jgi:hypothetical protein
MLLLLLFFLEQSQHIAGLGNFREIELGLDLAGRGPVSRCRRAGFRCKMLPDFFRFVRLDRT